MKRNSSLAKIILAAIFFQTNIAMAGENYTQQTNAEVNSNAELQPLVCQKVPSPYWQPFHGGERPMVDDPACVAENNRRANIRANARAVQNQAARVSTGDGTTLVAPKAPTYNCGSMTPYSSERTSCENAYAAENNQYKKDLEVYNNAQTLNGNDAANAEKEAILAQKSKSAAATLADIKQSNDKGKKSFDITAAVTMGLGVAAVVKGSACAVSCPEGPCCTQAPMYFALGAAFFLLNSKSKKQSAQHAASAANACKSMNQLSSSQTDCNSTASTGTTSSVSYDPVSGKCLPEDADACKQNPTIGAAPPSVKDALKTSGFATAKMNDLYTVTPDGSIKLKNGKIYKESDFKDASSLMALGLSAGAAKSVLDGMNGSNNSGLAKLGSEAKSDKAKVYKDTFGGAFGTDGITTVVDSGKAQTSDKKYSDNLGAANDDKKLSEERAPSSEGLAKEFNGELIGVAGDDIFLMMNRRYKLKSEQDSFIAQDLK